MRTRTLVVAVLHVGTMLGCAPVATSADGQLDRRIESEYPINLSVAPPDKATRAGLLQISQVAQVLLGFEEATVPLRAATIAPSDLRGMTVGGALDAVIAFDPRYRWRDLDGVIVVRPAEAWDDCSHYLNRHVAVSRRGLQMSSAIFLLFSLIDPSVPEPPKTPPRAVQSTPFDLSLEDASLLDVMNEIARRGRMSWEVSYGPRTGSKRATSITLREMNDFRTGFTSELTPVLAKCAG